MVTIIIWIVVVGLPLVITYLGIVSFLPKLSFAPLEPLNRKDALTAPFELTNEGFFAIRNVTFIWIPKNVRYNQGSTVSGAGQFSDGDKQLILKIDGGEKATIKSVLPLFFDAPVLSADLEVIVTYQPMLFPINIRKHFRFGTATDSDGIVRWYHRAATQ